MKLTQKTGFATKDEYWCELTEELDRICNFSGNFYRHYLKDFNEKPNNMFVIRIPGRTVGDICVDKNNVIISVKLAPDYIYPADINKQMKKYIGQKLVLFK